MDAQSHARTGVSCTVRAPPGTAAPGQRVLLPTVARLHGSKLHSFSTPGFRLFINQYSLTYPFSQLRLSPSRPSMGT